MRSSALMTLRTYADLWLLRLRRAPGTVRCYRGNLAMHILPALGETPLIELHRRDVRALLARLLELGRAPNTVHGVLTTLSAVCQSAVDDDLLPSNPCHGAARRLWERRPEGEPKAPTWDEFCAVMEQARNRVPALAPVYLLSAYAGLRPGEALALRAVHVDPPLRRISVERTYHGHGLDGPTKGRRKRVVTVGTAMAELLAERVETSKSPDFWLFPGRRGYPFHIRTIEKEFHESCRAAGVRRDLTPHSLRHGCATWLLEDGALEVQVQRLLGHGSVQLTIDLYARGAKLLPVADRLEHRPHGPLRLVPPKPARETG